MMAEIDLCHQILTWGHIHVPAEVLHCSSSGETASRTTTDVSYGYQVRALLL